MFFGMLPAIAVLDWSLAKEGIHSEYVQWGTFRKAKSGLTNITQAGVSGLGDAVGAYEQNLCGSLVWLHTSVGIASSCKFYTKELVRSESQKRS
jgi:hypothetical protein